MTEGKELFEYARATPHVWRLVKMSRHTINRKADQYNHARAIKLMMNNARDAARSYVKAHCNPCDKWDSIFDECARRECAQLMLEASID